VHLNNVIFVTGDLDAAAARFESEYGLRSEPGGEHRELGTRNRVVPLGPGYLELLAIADEEQAALSVVGQAVRRRLEKGEGLLSWAAEVEDVEAIAARLGTPVMRISREGYQATCTGVDEALADPYLPIFTQRDEGVRDPGADGSAGGLRWLEVAGDEPRLRDWLGGADLPVRVVEGPSAVLAMGVGDQTVR
jgi:Glyoxalase-like domain